MPRKQFEQYFQKEDWFIHDKQQINHCKSYHYYWFVSFPPVLCLPSKSFNKLLHTKEDAIQFRNQILKNYMERGERNRYKDIIDKYI